jgi:sulfatase maturation enzyme AslB (radical SAM superfamily)
MIVGNLIKQSAEEVWDSPGMEYWDTLMPRQCSACTLFAACHGGCRATALMLGARKDPLIRQPFVRRSGRSRAADGATRGIPRPPQAKDHGHIRRS